MTKAYAEIAVVFASALVAGDWQRAHDCLASTLRTELSPSRLQAAYLRMFQDYADGLPTSIHLDEQFTMEEWPDKQAGDVGWAYVAIFGDSFSEAVTVVVSDLDGPLRIRSVEWGRP